MAVDFTQDIKTTSRQMNNYVRRGQKIPKDVLAHYNNLVSASLNTDELENGDAGDNPAGGLVSTFPTVAITNGVLLAADTGREYVLIQNVGDETVYINFDAAAALQGGIQLLPGASWTSQIPQFVEAEINAIADTATSTLAVYTVGI